MIELAVAWIRCMQAAAAIPTPLIARMKDCGSRKGGNRMAAAVPHTLRKAGASAQNNQLSTKKKHFIFNTYQGLVTGWENVRWQPTATPLRGHRDVANERECRGGDARSPCRQLAHPAGPCPSHRARRQTARGRGRLRPCASKTGSVSSTCGEWALSGVRAGTEMETVGWRAVKDGWEEKERMRMREGRKILPLYSSTWPPLRGHPAF